MITPLIVANWKMYGDLDTYKSVIRELPGGQEDIEINTVICPPFPYLDLLNRSLPRGIQLGSQFISPHFSGPFTGEVSAEMVQGLGATYTLIGHSERRCNFHEDGAVLAQQLAMAVKYNLVPVLCVGENRDEYDSQNSYRAIHEQLDETLGNYRDQIDRLVIAYEPIWAIGSDNSADASYTSRIIQAIHERVISYPATRNTSKSYLYGGSVSPENAGSYLSKSNIDGLLIGRASLNAKYFRQICEIASAKNVDREYYGTPVV